MSLTIDRRRFIAGAVVAGGLSAAAATGAVTRAEAEEAHKAAVASYYACQEDWLGLPPETGEPAETVECDVLVLGGGHSGIHAALAAAEGGAKVAVVEKWAEDMRKVKGEDIGHINSQWLIDQGYGPYDVGEVTNEFVRRAGGRCNPEIIRKFVANSGEMFDHLQSLVSWPDERIEDHAHHRAQPRRVAVRPLAGHLPGVRFHRRRPRRVPHDVRRQRLLRRGGPVHGRDQP